MTAIVARPVFTVEIDGRLVTNAVRVRLSRGMDQGPAQAQIDVSGTLPAWRRDWSLVHIAMGVATSSGGGALYTRFSGYLPASGKRLADIVGTLIAHDPLVIAEQTECATVDGVDLSNAAAGQTDQAMVQQVLEATPLGTSPFYLASWIGGTGYTLGTVADLEYVWQEGESALGVIQRIDEATRYRTFALRGGLLVRAQAYAIPGPAPKLTFTEHVDILDGSLDVSTLDVINRWITSGFNDGGIAGAETATVAQYSPFLPNPGTPAAPNYRTRSFSSPLIEKSLQADAGDGIGCDTVGNALLLESNRKAYLVRFSTPRGLDGADICDPGDTIRVASSTRLELTDNLRVLHVDEECSPETGYLQTITAIGGVGSTAPITEPLRPDFTIQVEQELVVVAGVETTIYVASCVPAVFSPNGSITAYAWTATSGTPSSGSASTFATSYTSVAGKSIALQVTDSSGATGTVTRAVPTSTQQQYVGRPLYLAGTARFEAFDGSGTWRTDAENSAQSVTVATNGPVAGAGTDVMATADMLATGATETTPAGGGVTVTALWQETDISATMVLAGLSDGRLAVSHDAGATWTLVAGPSGSAPLRVVINRFNTPQWSVLTAAALYRTDDAGATWVTELTAAGGETFRDLVLSFARGMVVMSGGRLAVDRNGNGQTFSGTPPTDVVAVTADIREDRFYAYDVSGGTWYTTADGGTTFGPRTALPGAPLVVQPRGLWRDGAIRGLLYVAGGTGGAWKSVDGFGSSGGYYRIRQPGVGSSPVAADYKQVGADGLLVNAAAPVAATAFGSAGGTGKVRDLGGGPVAGPTAPPAGWEQPGYDDSAWAASAGQGAPIGFSTLSGTSWITHDGTQSGGDPAGRQWLHRHSFTAPSGHIASVTLSLFVDNIVDAVYLNGQWVYANPAVGGLSTPFVVTIAPGLVAAGATNALAFWIRDTGSGSALDYRLDLA